MSRDEYGWQPPENIARMRSGLQRVIAAHKVEKEAETLSKEELRKRLRESDAIERKKYEQEQEAMLERAREREAMPAEALPIPEPEPEPTATVPVEASPEAEAPAVDIASDPRYIEVRTPEYVLYQEENGEDRPMINRYVGTGRTISTYRIREPGEEGLVFVIGAPNIPAPAPPPTMEKHRWFDSFEDRPTRQSLASIEAARARHAAQNDQRMGSKMSSRTFAL